MHVLGATPPPRLRSHRHRPWVGRLLHSVVHLARHAWCRPPIALAPTVPVRGLPVWARWGPLLARTVIHLKRHVTRPKSLRSIARTRRGWCLSNRTMTISHAHPRAAHSRGLRRGVGRRRCIQSRMRHGLHHGSAIRLGLQHLLAVCPCRRRSRGRSIRMARVHRSEGHRHCLLT